MEPASTKTLFSIISGIAPRIFDRITSKITNQIVVRFVNDPDNRYLSEALKLYDSRIPEEDRVEAAEIVRWLREEKEAKKTGIFRAKEFLSIATINNKVCGVMCFCYYFSSKIAFIEYLVVDRLDKDHEVSFKLLKKAARLIKKGKCESVLIEVDHPDDANSESERQKRKARIRHFKWLAQQQGISLKVLDFHYKQPCLTIDAKIGREKPLLLMYAKLNGDVIGKSLQKDEVKELLLFLYKDVYGDTFEFDVDPEQNEFYKNYLSTLLRSSVIDLPDKVPTL